MLDLDLKKKHLSNWGQPRFYTLLDSVKKEHKNKSQATPELTSVGVHRSALKNITHSGDNPMELKLVFNAELKGSLFNILETDVDSLC